MRLKKEFQLCSIAGKDFLIPVGSAVVDVQSMLDLNDVGSFILHLLNERDYSEDELVDCIFQEYEADKDSIRCDLRTFVSKGVEVGFIDA